VATGGSAANTQNVADSDLELVAVGNPTKQSFAVQRFDNCDSSKITGEQAFIVHQGQTYSFDPRVKLLKNTLGAPAGGSVGDICPTVTRSFLNAFSCVRRASCGSAAARSVEITLNETSLRRWYTGSSRYVYYVTNLRLDSPFDGSPCSGATRWRRLAGVCAAPSALDAATQTIFANALRSSTDANPFVRDIVLPGSASCSASAGVSLEVDGTCYTHVHPNEFSVYDLTRWGLPSTPGVHPGGSNNIYKWAATEGVVNLPFPASHPMSRWNDENLLQIPLIGRWGDVVDFQALSTDLQTDDFASFVGAADAAVGSFESCGAPGEVGTNAFFGHRYIIPGGTDNEQNAMLEWPYALTHGKSMAWLNNVFQAKDQLRQRVAWALSQIFVMGDNNELIQNSVDAWANYADIFVRHAFGNYRDMMREVSYNPIMSYYLTYIESQSYQVSRTYPDENYAREIMQLFSIGLWKLNEDGTIKRKESDPNVFQETYTDQDIVDFARIWTGFDTQPLRSNIERLTRDVRNMHDPLQVKPAWRDKLPKTKLDAGYIGDGYPLCFELGSQPWRRPGAKFVYTGTTSIEGTLVDTQDPVLLKNRPRFQFQEDSPLFNLLCGPRTSTGDCTFPSEVVLDSIVPCQGQECEVI
jgi:hypothetical protein